MADNAYTTGSSTNGGFTNPPQVEGGQNVERAVDPRSAADNFLTRLVDPVNNIINNPADQTSRTILGSEFARLEKPAAEAVVEMLKGAWQSDDQLPDADWDFLWKFHPATAEIKFDPAPLSEPAEPMFHIAEGDNSNQPAVAVGPEGGFQGIAAGNTLAGQRRLSGISGIRPENPNTDGVISLGGGVDGGLDPDAKAEAPRGESGARHELTTGDGSDIPDNNRQEPPPEKPEEKVPLNTRVFDPNQLEPGTPDDDLRKLGIDPSKTKAGLSAPSAEHAKSHEGKRSDWWNPASWFAGRDKGRAEAKPVDLAGKEPDLKQHIKTVSAIDDGQITASHLQGLDKAAAGRGAESPVEQRNIAEQGSGGESTAVKTNTVAFEPPADDELVKAA